MATEIDKANLPERAKGFLKLDINDSDLSVQHDDQYLIRILIDKVNELTRELNTIKDALAGE